MFNNATKFQERKKGQNCVSVVVLDEVGLAEDSPSLPLKTLHPLLEDGTTGSNDVISFNEYVTTILRAIYIHL